MINEDFVVDISIIFFPDTILTFMAIILIFPVQNTIRTVFTVDQIVLWYFITLESLRLHLKPVWYFHFILVREDIYLFSKLKKARII